MPKNRRKKNPRPLAPAAMMDAPANLRYLFVMPVVVALAPFGGQSFQNLVNLVTHFFDLLIFGCVRIFFLLVFKFCFCSCGFAVVVFFMCFLVYVLPFQDPESEFSKGKVEIKWTTQFHGIRPRLAIITLPTVRLKKIRSANRFNIRQDRGPPRQNLQRTEASNLP